MLKIGGVYQGEGSARGVEVKYRTIYSNGGQEKRIESHLGPGKEFGKVKKERTA